MFEFIDRAIENFAGEATLLSKSESLEIIYQNIIDEQRSDNSKILVLGDVRLELLQGLVKDINSKDSSLKLEYATNPVLSIEALKKLSASDKVVIAVCKHSSRVTVTDEIINACREKKKGILGYIMI